MAINTSPGSMAFLAGASVVLLRPRAALKLESVVLFHQTMYFKKSKIVINFHCVNPA